MMMEQRSRSVLVGQRLPAGTVYSLKPCLRRKTSPPCHLLDGMKCVSIRKSCSRLMMLWLGLEQCSLTPSTQRHPYLRVSRIHCLFATLSKLCSNYISVYLLVASVQLSFVLFSLFLVLSLSLCRSLFSVTFSHLCLLLSCSLSLSLFFLSLFLFVVPVSVDVKSSSVNGFRACGGTNRRAAALAIVSRSVFACPQQR